VIFDLFAQLSNVGTLAIGGLGIFVALRNQHRQLNAQMLIEFSGRFQNLLRMFPTEAWLANRNPSQPMPPPSQELTDCTLYAMQFIADVYYLHKSGYLSKKLWMVWDREIRNTLTGPVFQREWQTVEVEFAHSRDFVQYINTVMRSKRARHGIPPAEGRDSIKTAASKPVESIAGRRADRGD
jgi:hypothetical protein